jgi:hypothetical protein
MGKPTIAVFMYLNRGGELLQLSQPPAHKRTAPQRVVRGQEL